MYDFSGKYHTAMPLPLPSAFPPGRVFRTRELAPWTSNPSRTTERWVKEGVCVRLRNGLYAIPKPTEFGPAPPSQESLLHTFLEGDPFVITGPPVWNALRLGSNQVFALPLVYNRKRSGTFRLGGASFRLRRVRFPHPPCLEWFVIDLLENLDSVCLATADAERNLGTQLREALFDSGKLREMATEYGSKATQALVHRALEASST